MLVSVFAGLEEIGIGDVDVPVVNVLEQEGWSYWRALWH